MPAGVKAFAGDSRALCCLHKPRLVALHCNRRHLVLTVQPADSAVHMGGGREGAWSMHVARLRGCSRYDRALHAPLLCIMHDTVGQLLHMVKYQPSLQRCATNNPTLAGSAGGVVEAFCLAPIDVIKTRLQLDGTKQYRSIIHCGTSIAEKEGVGALWKGVVPFATHLTFKYALRMGSNSFYQNLMRDKEGNLNQYRRLAAGAMAGITEAVVHCDAF